MLRFGFRCNVGGSAGRPIGRWVGPSVGGSVGGSAGGSVGGWAGGVGRWVGRGGSAGRSVGRSAGGSVILLLISLEMSSSDPVGFVTVTSFGFQSSLGGMLISKVRYEL